MAYEYDPYLNKSSVRWMYIVSVGLVIGGIYLVPLSAHAWRTNTKVDLCCGGHSELWPWEGFATAFLMVAVGIFAWWAARSKSNKLRDRERK